MITIDDIRGVALDLPGAFEQPSYGDRPSWRTKRRMFAWVRDNPEALVVWVESVDERDAMIAADPDIFFTTSHYDGHPIVLVDLERVGIDEATELIIESYLLRAERTLVAKLRDRLPPAEVGSTYEDAWADRGDSADGDLWDATAADGET